MLGRKPLVVVKFVAGFSVLLRKRQLHTLLPLPNDKLCQAPRFGVPRDQLQPGSLSLSLSLGREEERVLLTMGTGCPQGSIMGPILFLLYVKYLPDVVVNSKVASFADDTKLCRRVDSTQDAILLQNDLDKLEAWSISSGLVFNQKKC